MESRFAGPPVSGMKEARAAFQRVDPVVKERILEATEDTAIRVLSGAKRRVAPHRRYGFLERYLGYSVSKASGSAKVGLPRVAAVIPGGAAPTSRYSTIRRKGASTFHVYGTGSAKGARVVYPSKYGHLVEFGHARGQGHSSAPPYPFMIPSAEENKDYYLRRCKDSGKKVERDLSVSRFV